MAPPPPLPSDVSGSEEDEAAEAEAAAATEVEAEAEAEAPPPWVKTCMRWLRYSVTKTCGPWIASPMGMCSSPGRAPSPPSVRRRAPVCASRTRIWCVTHLDGQTQRKWRLGRGLAPGTRPLGGTGGAGSLLTGAEGSPEPSAAA